MMWGSGWWLFGAIMMVVCIVMMVRMMSHGQGHGQGTHDDGRGAEGTLADRLARGEIDVDEYERLLEVLRRPDRPAHT